jgi:selenide,water dikinase
VLRALDNLFPAEQHPNLLVGLGSPDDAAVYRLNDEQALIQTVDFFTPIVDTPYEYGAIAAANALSDVYAMGGEVLFALNIAALPPDLPTDMMAEILRGGADVVRSVGAAIAGGHTIQDKEPKYGLAVTGLVHPDRILTKGGSRPGDALVLTKPLGTGTITTALKRGQVDPAHLDAAIASMMRLNRAASQAARAAVAARRAGLCRGVGLRGRRAQQPRLLQPAGHLHAARARLAGNAPARSADVRRAAGRGGAGARGRVSGVLRRARSASVGHRRGS